MTGTITAAPPLSANINNHGATSSATPTASPIIVCNRLDIIHEREGVYEMVFGGRK